jgi:hypothetical protein
MQPSEPLFGVPAAISGRNTRLYDSMWVVAAACSFNTCGILSTRVIIDCHGCLGAYEIFEARDSDFIEYAVGAAGVSLALAFVLVIACLLGTHGTRCIVSEVRLLRC